MIACGVERPNPVVGVFDVITADQNGYVAGGGQKFHVPAARVLGKIVHQGDVTGGRVDIVGDVGVEKPVRGLPAPRVVPGVPQRPAQRIGAEVETLGVNGLVFDGTVQFGQQQFRFALAAGDESGKAESAGDIWRKSLHRFGFIDKFIKKDESRTVPGRRFVTRFALRGPDQPIISIFTSRRMSVAGTSITRHFSFSSNTGFTVRPPTFAFSIFPAAELKPVGTFDDLPS